MGFLNKYIKFATDPLGITSNLYHAATGTPTAQERRSQQNAVNDQIKAYREQTEITKSEIARKKNEEVAEKRRIEEKQIRSLRRNRGSSLLGTQPTNDNDAGMTTKLGG